MFLDINNEGNDISLSAAQSQNEHHSFETITINILNLILFKYPTVVFLNLRSCCFKGLGNTSQF